MNIEDYLLDIYKENMNYCRHHETLRSNVTNYIIAVAGAILAFISKGNHSCYSWILPLFLILIGLFGALFSAKEYERVQFHQNRARHYRQFLEKVLDKKLKDDPWIDIEGLEKKDVRSLGFIRELSDSMYNKKTKNSLVSGRLNIFWIVFHLLISCIGVVLLVIR